MRLLLDEMLSPIVAAGLRRRGLDVVAIVEEPGLAGLDDGRVLAVAIAERRVLVTNNARDFRRLVRDSADVPHFGMILVPAGAARTRGASGAIVRAIAALAERHDNMDALRGAELWLRL